MFPPLGGRSQSEKLSGSGMSVDPIRDPGPDGRGSIASANITVRSSNDAAHSPDSTIDIAEDRDRDA